MMMPLWKIPVLPGDRFSSLSTWLLGNLNPECPQKDHRGELVECVQHTSSMAEVAMITLCMEYRCTPSATGAWEKMLVKSARAVAITRSNPIWWDHCVPQL
jgi:hypothetical protein